MSGWNLRWFGGGGAAKAKDAPKTATLQLREHLERLQKRENHYEQLKAKEEEKAREYLKKNNQSAAKAALRRKKLIESTLEPISSQIMAIDQQIITIENANVNKETLNVMKGANAALKQIHGGLTVDKVEDTMEELRDQQDISTQIGEAISRSVADDMLDEDDLEAELDQLKQETLDEQMLNTGNVPVGDKVSKMPAAPSTLKPNKQTAEEEDEEAELRKLQEEMAM